MMGLPSLARTGVTHPATPEGVISYDADRTESSLGGAIPDEPWATESIEVRIGDAYRGGQFKNLTAVIVSAGRDSCRVVVRDKAGTEMDSLTVPTIHLEPVLPSKKDRVKVIRGELKGNVGLLVDTDGPDGLVRMEPTFDVQVIPLPLLARYHPK